MATTLSFPTVIVRKSPGLPSTRVTPRSLAAVQALAGHPLTRQLAQRVFWSPSRRHPLAPAALRVEKSVASHASGTTVEQKAITVWLENGPSLPGVSPAVAAGGSSGLRLGAGLLGLAAFIGMGFLAARRQWEEQNRI